MALIFVGKTVCSICHSVLAAGQEIKGLPHLLAPGHPLSRFSDSAMHESCYQSWEHRAYFDALLAATAELVTQRRGIPWSPEAEEAEAQKVRDAITSLDREFGHSRES